MSLPGLGDRAPEPCAGHVCAKKVNAEQSAAERMVLYCIYCVGPPPSKESDVGGQHRFFV